jgi:hypothetical protein
MRILLALLIALVALPAFAGETVKSPNVTKGLLELEEKGRYQMDSAASRNHKKELEINATYGVTDHWRTRIEAQLDEDKNSDMTYRRTKFENVYQTTKSKDGAWLDTALYNEVTFSDRSDSSHDVTFGVLARKDVDVFTNTGNLYIKKDWGDTAAKGFNFIYRWQTKYNWRPWLQPGVEILGDTKKREAFRDQSLGIGPGIYGSIPFDTFGGDKNQNIGYEAVYTFGATTATPEGTVKWKLKYAIQF